MLNQYWICDGKIIANINWADSAFWNKPMTGPFSDYKEAKKQLEKQMPFPAVAVETKTESYTDILTKNIVNKLDEYFVDICEAFN